VSVVVEFRKKVDLIYSCIFCMKNYSDATTNEVVTMQNVEDMSDKLTVRNFCTQSSSSQ
jgi:hypothetical protein